MLVCPICGARFEPGAQHKTLPFCGSRCKTIDLGKWLSESYRVAGSREEDDGEEDDSSEALDPSAAGAAHEEEA
jgi:endogenous inhibitor of DNA gyrase (YacG/DUF329 family)